MLGDSIETATRVSGIKAMVEKMAKLTEVPCGCDKRKDILNNPNLLINKILYRNTDSKEPSINYNNM